jgi:hypothetical protein
MKLAVLDAVVDRSRNHLGTCLFYQKGEHQQQAKMEDRVLHLNTAKISYVCQLSYLAWVKNMTPILLIIACLAAHSGYAQTEVWESGQKKIHDRGSSLIKSFENYKDHLEQWGTDTSYRRAFSIGGRLRTDGWTGGLLYERKTDRGTRHQFLLRFSEIRHEKQIKQKAPSSAFPALGAPSDFVFGKVNNLYLLQLGYGRERILLPGILEGNVSVGFRYGGGFSLAMLKPYYLKLIHVSYVPEQVGMLAEEKYSSANDSLFLDRRFILGASGWNKGLDEVKYVPGLFAEAAFSIMPNKRKVGLIQTITLGGQFSIHTRHLPIMAQGSPYSWAAGFFAGLELGKRW